MTTVAKRILAREIEYYDQCGGLERCSRTTFDEERERCVIIGE